MILLRSLIIMLHLKSIPIRRALHNARYQYNRRRRLIELHARLLFSAHPSTTQLFMHA